MFISCMKRIYFSIISEFLNQTVKNAKKLKKNPKKQNGISYQERKKIKTFILFYALRDFFIIKID